MLVTLPSAGTLAQVVSPDARIPSGVTFGNGREVGPQVAFHGPRGVAVWYEDQGGLQPVHCAFTEDGGATWNPGGFVTDLSGELGQCTICAGPGESFHVLNRRWVSSPELEIHRGEIVNGSLVWQPAVLVTSGGGIEHPALACDPAGGALYISYTQLDLPAESTATVYFTRSTDGGAIWSAPLALSPATCHGSSVAVGPGGEVYVVWQDFAAGQVMLRRSLDGGASFEPTVAVGAIAENVNTEAPGCGYIFGRTHTQWPYSLRVVHYPSLAVDRSAGPERGAVYVAWPEMATGTAGPFLGLVLEQQPNDNDYFAGASTVAIGQDFHGFVPTPDARLPDHYDLWTFEGVAGQTVTLTGRYIYTPQPYETIIGSALITCGDDTLRRLTATVVSDGSFAVPPLAFTLPRTGRYYIGIGSAGPYNREYRMQLRELVVDPASTARDHRDVVLVGSRDAGQTWSTKRRLNTGAAQYDDILPVLAVDEAGQLHAVWYGRYDDSVCGYLADTYWTLSRDGGASFLPPQRVSTVGGSWDFGGATELGVAGDYLGLATVGTTAHVAWMDNRNLAVSSSDIYGAQIEAGGATAVVVARFTAETAGAAIRLRWTVTDAGEVAGFQLQRARGEGAWELLGEPVLPASGSEYAVEDDEVEPGARYRYRLEVRLREGGSLWAGPVEAMLPAIAERFALRAAPNPSAGPVALWVSLPARGAVSVSVYDLAGKEVARLHEGETRAGLLRLDWAGRSTEGRALPPGLYWARARSAGAEAICRLARVP
jgi:flagellar hook capping protein FlgD